MAKSKGAKVTVRDLGYERLRKRMVELGKPFVTVGVHQSSIERSADDGSSSPNMALVASVHEFGSSDGRVPERSYLRSTMDSRRDDIATVMQKVEKKVVDGQLTPENGLGVVGQWIQGAVQKTITNLDDPPLKQRTIDRRRNGGSNPLVDTGQLRASITYEVQTGQRPETEE